MPDTAMTRPLIASNATPVTRPPICETHSFHIFQLPTSFLLANTTPIQRSCIESVLECVPADPNPFQIANLQPTHHRQSAGSHPVSSRRRRDETPKNNLIRLFAKKKVLHSPSATHQAQNTSNSHAHRSWNRPNPSRTAGFTKELRPPKYPPSSAHARTPHRTPHVPNFVLGAYRLFPFGVMPCIHRS